MFWATAQPWQLRMERLLETGPAAEGLTPWPDLLLIDDRSWHAWSGDRVIKGTRAEGSTHGTLNLDLLLRPAVLSGALEFVEGDEVTRVGRRAFRVRGLPSAGLVRRAPAMVVIGATDYVVTADVEYGILLASEVYFGDQLVRREELSDLTIDAPMQPDLFSPSGTRRCSLP